MSICAFCKKNLGPSEQKIIQIIGPTHAGNWIFCLPCILHLQQTPMNVSKFSQPVLEKVSSNSGIAYYYRGHTLLHPTSRLSPQAQMPSTKPPTGSATPFPLNPKRPPRPPSHAGHPLPMIPSMPQRRFPITPGAPNSRRFYSADDIAGMAAPMSTPSRFDRMPAQTDIPVKNYPFLQNPDFTQQTPAQQAPSLAFTDGTAYLFNQDEDID